MNYYKHIIYFLIGFGNVFVTLDGPITQKTLVASVLGGLVALKALGSNPNTDKKDNENGN